MNYIGIDNGLHGCVAVITKGRLVLHDMPIVIVKKGKKKKNKFDERRINKLFESLGENKSCAFIEEVRFMPKQSSQSVGSIGYGHGLLIMALMSHDIPFQKISVRKWQEEFCIYGKGQKTKCVSYETACRLFPDNEFNTPRGKILDGRCDSALIAEYCRRMTSTQRTKP